MGTCELTCHYVQNINNCSCLEGWFGGQSLLTRDKSVKHSETLVKKGTLEPDINASIGNARDKR